MEYEQYVEQELNDWERNLIREPNGMERISREVSRKLNKHIPDKVHQMITSGIRTMVDTIRTGVQFVPKGDLRRGFGLQEMDRLAKERVTKWTQWASAEGAGTGLGGFKLSLVDFPALLTIKIKMMNDLSYIYGFHPNDERERLFLLRLFQLEYGNDQTKLETLAQIKAWSELKSIDIPLATEEEQFDWQQFQQDYRDSLDFRKLLQIVPGFGAVVGAWANYGLVKSLGTTSINAYRIRVLNRNSQ